MSSINTLEHDADFLRPVVTGSDFVECGKEFGVDVALRLLTYGESSLEYLKRCASARSAAIRSASSAGSSGTRTTSTSVAGLTGTRLESISRVDTWRGSGDKTVVGRTKKIVYADGLCYAKLFNRSAAESQVTKCGVWPTFGSLVRLSQSAFQSLEDLERFRLKKTGENVFHVVAGGASGVSFLDAVATYGRGIKAQPGTLVRSVLDSGRVKEEEVKIRVFGNARLGGNPADLDAFDGAAELFGFGDGCDLRSVCPVPFMTDAVAFLDPRVESSHLDRLSAFGWVKLAVEKLEVGNTLVRVYFFCSNVSQSVTDRRMVANLVAEIHAQTSISLMDVQSFGRLRAQSVRMVT